MGKEGEHFMGSHVQAVTWTSIWAKREGEHSMGALFEQRGSTCIMVCKSFYLGFGVFLRIF